VNDSGERWLPVPGYEGLYEVSDDGQVRSLPRKSQGSATCGGRALKPWLGNKGYLLVGLWRNGTCRTRTVHRLVCEAFHGPCPDSYEACHNDGNPLNNHADNLRWDSHSENMLDRTRHGTFRARSQTHCVNGHPLGADNLYSLPGRPTWRICLACKRTRERDAQRRYKARRRANAAGMLF
jgi:hypothetical protein